MVRDLVIKIATPDAEGVDTMEGVDTCRGHMFFKAHHDKIVARDRAVDEKDHVIILDGSGTIGIEALALVLATAGDKETAEG